MVRPSRLAIFWRRPALGLPLQDRLLVALRGPTHRALRGEPQIAQQRPHVRDAEGVAELALDQRGHPRQRPELGGKPVGHRALQQPLGEPGTILLVEHTRPAQRTPPPRLRIFGQHARPGHRGLPSHLARTRNLGLRDPAREHAHAAPPPDLEFLEIAPVPFRRHESPPSHPLLG
jgi:hypothetical protein